MKHDTIMRIAKINLKKKQTTNGENYNTKISKFEK